MSQHSRSARRPSPWRRATALLGFATLAVGGCGDGPFDPVATDNAVEGVFATIENNQAVQSIAVLADGFPAFSGAPAALQATLPIALSAARGTPQWFGARLSQLELKPPPHSTAAPAVLFPADLLGKTFVYNTQTGAYEVDLNRSGAPATGVRLILYAVDPILRQVVTPLNEIGHLDLTDEGTPAADAVGIKAVINDVTVLDYVASASITTSSVSFSAQGVLSDGTTNVNFTLSQTFSETDGVMIDYDVSVPDQDARVRLQVTADPQGGSVHITFTIEHDGRTVVLDVTGTDTSISGTVSHNGETVIEISGNPDAPTFTDVAGNPLSPAQLVSLKDLFDGAGDIFDHLDDLLAPAYHVLQISFFFAV